MNKKAHPQKTVLESILDWSQGRPTWQRDALRRIIVKGKLDDNDYKELAKLCKECRSRNNVKPNLLDKNHLPANPGADAPVSLNSIKNIIGVNNLSTDQLLTFEPNGITIIYGHNGAGKSGYARILKRACRARHSGEIHPNIYDSKQSIPSPPSATISYTIGGVEQTPENWQDKNYPHPILSAVSVFDSDCADIHINEKNEVAFRPFGLDIPDELAIACQRVKEILTVEKNQLNKSRNTIFSKPPWKENTIVGQMLTSLKHDTDIAKISVLATLSEEQKKRLTHLREDLSKDPVKAAAEQKLKADNIKGLLKAVKLFAAQTTDDSLTHIASLGYDAKLKREAARLSAEKAFSGDPLMGVGGEVWRILWDSARRYSMQVAYPKQSFPPFEEGYLCVLCQQPLGADAIQRMRRFENFIKEDTEKQAQQAEESFKNAFQKLTQLNISILTLKSNLQEVKIQNPILGNQILRFIASARLRRYTLVKAVKNSQEFNPPNSTLDPSEELETLELSVRSYAEELAKSATDNTRKILQKELDELSDCATIQSILPEVTKEVNRLKAVQLIDECFADTTTNSITKIGNEIADTIITPKLRDRFQEEIVKLAAEKVRVEIIRSGGKFGSPQYQIQLFAKPDAKVGIILSEGEKTCVALAAFLTELATATHCSTLVFDDPVCSLDHRWRKQVAKRLIEEVEHRQIIIFTHDLVFVNDLHDLAQEKQCPAKLITLSREAKGAGIVSDGLPWKAQSIEDRIDKLEKTARNAKLLYDNNQEEEYSHQAVSIYNNLRASWERALEDIAFFRIVQRHRDYIETKNLKKVTVINESDCDAFRIGFKKCCDMVDAHDPSRARNAGTPSPNDILKDISALKDWVTSLRDRQKNIKI